MINFPEAFKKNMQEILGTEYPEFEKAIETEVPVSIRTNPAKPVEGLNLEFDGEVLWSKYGKYLKSRPVFTLDPSFHAGAYYVQEASSMFLEEVFLQTVPQKESLRVLDLCGAPGGKSTHLASLLTENDLLVSNEVIKSRLGVLKENLQKWGFSNVIVSNQDPETFADLEGFFDVVVVDAPCSGEGLFRKDPNAISEWSENHVQMCSARQKRILSAAAMLVAPGGVLIYSTCTYNPYENQENAAWLCRTLDFDPVKLTLNPEWKVAEKGGGYQFFPHKTRGEGFFISAFRNLSNDRRYAKARINLNRLSRELTAIVKPWIKATKVDDYEFYKKEDGNIFAIKASLLPDFGSVMKALNRRSSGLEIGIFKGKDFIPSHAFALSDLINPDLDAVELNRDNALKFLKKEAFGMPQEAKDGWLVMQYSGLNLGWVKKIGGRVNNYLPTEWRIRMEIE